MNEIEVIPNIEDMIYEIRGKQVMLDSDLAKLYQCKNGTKEINQAVKNNLEKFPERFSWILSDKDSEDFLVKNFDQKIETRGGRYKNPRVFTEQGIAMLATILKGKTATKVSISIMDAFVKMRHFIKDNLIEQKYINNMVIEHDNSIKLLQDAFDKLEEKKKINEIYFNGQIYDAYSKIKDIFFESKKELIIIDNYADKKILDMIKNINTKVIIITKENSRLSKLDIEEYNKEYHNLSVIHDNTFHDRYFIIDRSIFYHSGTSINYIGLKTFSINILEDDLVKELIINKVKELIYLFKNK